ncbi:MAG: PolC-type DNA polymerase III [Bacilli bacterium]|nr:PolC-type DNA polymerase III [Bacilli bacterium]
MGKNDNNSIIDDSTTIRFFESIGLNFVDFDLKIEQLYKKKENEVLKWYFEFHKDFFWKYDLFNLFITSLKKIKNYEYEMHFLYNHDPSFDDIKNFILEYCWHNFKIVSNFEVKVDEKFIEIIFLNQEEEKNSQIIINSLKDVMNFISVKQEIKISLKEINSKDYLNLNADEKSNVAEQYLAQYKQQLINKYKKIDNFSNIKNGENVKIIGEIYEANILTIKDKKQLVCGVGNFKSAILFKKYIENDKDLKVADIIIKNFRNKETRIFTRALILGEAALEKNKEIYIKAKKIELLDDFDRKDESPKKRVELHLHTTMSQSDGVVHINNYINFAKKMGYKAIAVTDHGVVQAFPLAQKTAKEDIKVLYGCEFYVVNEKFNFIFNPSNILLKDSTYVCLDLETTGLSSEYDRIIEFGAVKIQNGIIIDRIDILINPETILKGYIVNLTRINNEILAKKQIFKDVWSKIKNFIGDSILVTHNAIFDISFLNHELKMIGLPNISNPIIDTLTISRYLFSDAKLHNLEALSNRLKIDIYDIKKAHRADFDAEILGHIWCELLNKIFSEFNNNVIHSDLANLKISETMIKNAPSDHMIVLAKNSQGLKDLFFLISLSHLKYASDIPKIPFNEIQKLRKNFLIGSACFNGEIFNTAYLYGEDILKKKMEFYDYIEVQPISCYKPLLTKCKFLKANKDGKRKAQFAPVFYSEEDIKKILLKIIRVADECNKMVCATGDVHYINAEEKIFREVYIATDGIGHRPHPLCTNPRGVIENHVYTTSGDQFFLTTDEMLEAFNFLDKEKAFEIVVENTNKIADMCEKIYPIKNKLYVPHIKNADENLKKIVYEKANKMYKYNGQIPDKILKRLEMEISRIIGSKNSYAVNFLLAKEVVNQANRDGYFVGSRGSVGSSLVAYLLDITEVNPLSPHYYCKKCNKIEWYNGGEYLSGIDLPEKKCDCGNYMSHNGQNIPFETFLGINEQNTKVPDIDLNFANTYQMKAHNFLKEKFGNKHVFRAGTINTYKDKMAFNCVKDFLVRSKHLEINNVSKNFKNYLASRCVGIKKTTGQHPGGIILIPKEFEVYDFTPIQYPADNINANWEITHFEFSTIHDTVLKLDLLGHVDPLALKMMGELSGVDFINIPLNDKRVLSLFTTCKELHLKKNILNVQTGTAGLPEFGTDFVQKVLKVAKPKTFNDLVIISGITHGTDVWNNNAESLLKDNKATLSEIIGCRDDIMIFLIKQGLTNEISFQIMEDIRKGKGLQKEQAKIMREYKVPDFYIDSCNKIKYLFPRAHAVAYVTQAVRVGYFKIYYPLVFYAVYFSLRSEQYDIDSMINGIEKIKSKIKELENKRKNKDITVKELSIIDTLKMACEMYERGYKFENIDINKSQSKNFIINGNSLIPPFIVIDSLGDTISENIIEVRKIKKFTSIKDFEERTKVIKKHIQKLKDVGAFKNVVNDDNISKQLEIF